MTATTLRRRATATVAAAALVLPLSVAAVAAVAQRRAGSTFLVDRGWPPYAGQPYGYVSPYSSTASLDTSEATSAQSDGLVTITSEVGFGEGEAAGTGIVIGSDGLVVTNHHVVEGATSIEVTVVSDRADVRRGGARLPREARRRRAPARGRVRAGDRDHGLRAGSRSGTT